MSLKAIIVKFDGRSA